MSTYAGTVSQRQSLTPARAIAAAAIISAHPDPMPHWEGIAADLREWTNENDQEGEMPSQDEENGLESATLGARNEAVPQGAETPEGPGRSTSTDYSGRRNDV